MLAANPEAVTCPTPSALAVDRGTYAPRKGVVFLLENYSATMVPEGKKMPQCTEKMNNIEHGRIVVSGESLGRMFDQKMQKSGERKITDLKVEMKGDHVAISGKVHKVLPIPFSVEGPVDSPNGSDLRLHADKVKATGIPIKGLLDMVGVELGSLLNPGANKGVVVKGDDLYFLPEKLGHVHGHIQRVQVSGNKLVVDFGGPAKQMAAAKPPKTPNSK